MPTVKDYIRHLRQLPPAPHVVPELMRLLNRADVDTSEIVTLVSYDAALTANVLRTSNSAYFGSTSPAANLGEAVSRLGFQRVFQVVTAATASQLLGSAQEGYGMEQGELWKHSLATATASQLVARHRGEDENVAFTAGLLHDLGKTILSHSLLGDYSKIVKETEVNGRSLLEAETKLVGMNHAELGAELLQMWKFPPNLVSAVWFHHSPKGARAHERLASCVFLGNMIACFMGHAYGYVPFALRSRAEALAELGLSPQSVPQLMIETFEQVTVIEALFSAAA